jgi:hypothetical protein
MRLQKQPGQSIGFSKPKHKEQDIRHLVNHRFIAQQAFKRIHVALRSALEKYHVPIQIQK